MEKVNLDIKGMHCGMCANGIQMMLSVKGGVKKADISWETKKGVVEYDPEKITIDELLKTVASTGEYSATVIKG
ncbi:MAG: heavy-metal-associated domain-containing protein [Candidatus Hydrothermarchaeales archaeon]